MSVKLPSRVSSVGRMSSRIPVDVRALDYGVMRQPPLRNVVEGSFHAEKGSTPPPAPAPVFPAFPANLPTEEFIERLAVLLADRVDRRVYFAVTPFSAGVAAAQVRPEEYRRYFFIQNTHAAQTLTIGFGDEPTAGTGLLIGAGGFFEPLWIPQNSIWVLGSGAATTGVIIYASTK